jgi:two-component system, OmpR family, sensor histidine kinase VicK
VQRKNKKRATVNSTRILVNQDEIIKEIKRTNNAANKISIAQDLGYENELQLSFRLLQERGRQTCKKREGRGLRWITSINKDNLSLLKIFLEFWIQIRHIKDTPSVNFGVSDKEVALTIEKMEDGGVSQSFLISNEPLYVNHFNSLFEE